MTRQYCGQLGKQDNCQVAVSLSVANDHASLGAPSLPPGRYFRMHMLGYFEGLDQRARHHLALRRFLFATPVILFSEPESRDESDRPCRKAKALRQDGFKGCHLEAVVVVGNGTSPPLRLYASARDIMSAIA